MSGSRPVATDLTARIGVEAVRSLLVRELGWYPREPSDPDYGVDIFVETATDEGVPAGRLLGVQVKSGPSYFGDENELGFVYYASDRHVEYWQQHTLPVIVVLYDPDAEVAYWEVVNAQTVSRTETSWKLIVPKSQRLGAGAEEALSQLVAEAEDPLNQLRSEKSWMVMLRDGGEVYVEVAEWVNKSSGRGTVVLVGTTGDGKEVRRERAVFFGLSPYEEELPRLFPWADLEVDELMYENSEEPGYETRSGIRPYEVVADEVAQWRLRLTLNDLGKGLLSIDAYIEDTQIHGRRP